jgi:16S rRNA (guanine527-N7)-methyltransferase
VIEQLEQAAGRPVSRETFEKIEAYVALLRGEAERQNLVSAATLASLWDRHVLDSAQLLRFSPAAGASWVDVGSGAGLPGIIVACMVAGPVTLIEPRRLRADFLRSSVEQLGLRATIVQSKAERFSGSFDVITGRAVAPLGNFLSMCDHLSTKKTVWILPKGRSAQSELAEAQRTWQGSFRVEPSVTDEDSRIIVATEVRAGKR